MQKCWVWHITFDRLSWDNPYNIFFVVCQWIHMINSLNPIKYQLFSIICRINTNVNTVVNSILYGIKLDSRVKFPKLLIGIINYAVESIIIQTIVIVYSVNYIIFGGVVKTNRTIKIDSQSWTKKITIFEISQSLPIIENKITSCEHLKRTRQWIITILAFEKFVKIK